MLICTSIFYSPFKVSTHGITQNLSPTYGLLSVDKINSKITWENVR